LIRELYAHVGSPACAALLTGIGRGVEHLHKADGSGGYAARGAHRSARGRRRERKARAAAALVKSAGVFTASNISGMAVALRST
jgi:hypothetical protein